MACATNSVAKHNRELSIKLKPYRSERDHVLQQLIGKIERNEDLRKDVLSRISQWENNMIERIRDKAKQAREQFAQWTDDSEKVTIENARKLIKEIRTKEMTDVDLEQDIERFNEDIRRLKKSFVDLVNKAAVELYIEPSHMIDWNHLIYLRKISSAMISAPVDKQIILENQRHTGISMNSNEQHKFMPSSTPDSSSSSSDDERNSSKLDSNDRLFSATFQQLDKPISDNVKKEPTMRGWGTRLPAPAPMPTIALSSTPLSLNTQKRQRAPLCIVDPVSDKPAGIPSGSFSNNDNDNMKTETLTEGWRTQLPSPAPMSTNALSNTPLSLNTQKRQRAPLFIVDPVSHKPTGIPSGNLSSDSNNVSLQMASMSARMREAFAKLLSAPDET